jgi:Protein of unknown function (DUF3631)
MNSIDTAASRPRRNFTLQKLARALEGDIAGDQVLAPGPGHSPRDRSLSVKLDSTASDGFVVHSFAGDDPIACRDHVREKFGLPTWKPTKKDGKGNGKSRGSGAGKPWSPTIAKHIYRTTDGAPYLCVHRLADKSAFPQYHWDGEKWVSGKPQGPKIPYRLPELLAAPLAAPVYICEGEKDVDNLSKIGFTATCNSEGADPGTGKKWAPELSTYFTDRNVYILPDNDELGRKHAQFVARSLAPVAASVRVVKLPGLPNKGDVSDWLVNDSSGARLVKECARAPLWEPSAESKDAGVGARDEELVAELAALSALEYAKHRKGAADKIGIGVGELDKIVAQARAEAHPPTLARWQVEPWDEEVTMADLLQALRDTFAAHVILPEHGATTMAVWTLHAWAIDAAYVSPFLMFTSPEMRCGKSKALALLFRTCPRSAFASNISPAAVFRYVEAHHPTLIVDEADTFVRDNEEMRGILNGGHTRDTAYVIRCTGEKNEPKEFSTWGPKAIAGIGKLAATLQDRSIILPMKRKRREERVTKLRAQDTKAFVNLRRQAARWANDNLEALKDARPDIPVTLNDRAQDNWEPLLAIADLAGGGWPATVRAAAVALEAEGDRETTIKAQLLTDIRDVFTAHNFDKAGSKFLVAQLADDETKPWGSFGKDAKPITERQLARLLREFGIKPGNLRIGGAIVKGYTKAGFVDAWERYASSSSAPRGFRSATSATSNDSNGLEEKSSATPDLFVADRNGSNPLEIDTCSDVADRNPLGSKTGDVGADRPEGPHVCVQCHGPPDGTEEQCSIGDGAVWLHPECQRFYVRALEEAEGA